MPLTGGKETVRKGLIESENSPGSEPARGIAEVRRCRLLPPPPLGPRPTLDFRELKFG